MKTMKDHPDLLLKWGVLLLADAFWKVWKKISDYVRVIVWARYWMQCLKWQKYPKELHELHNDYPDYPRASDKIEIKREMQSEY